MLDELGVHWQADGARAWDVGAGQHELRITLDDRKTFFSLYQPVFELDRKNRKDADFLRSLLEINASTKGACVAVTDIFDGEDWVMVIGRLNAEALTREALATTLEDVVETLDAVYE